MDKIVILYEQQQAVEYELIGEVSHHGPSISSGHYTSSVQLGSSAAHFNDEKVGIFLAAYITWSQDE